MEEFHKVRRLPPYVFEQVNRLKASARAGGADIIDLGMGNPDLPTPQSVVDKLCEVVQDPRTHRYSSSKGIPGLRRAQAAYYARRFGVKLNPDTQVVATLGSKEGFANMAQAITAPGDVILCPNPTYPIHAFGFLMTGGVIRSISVEPDDTFFPPLERAIRHSIPKPIALVINYPSNPTAHVATLDFYKEVVAFAKKHDIVILSDLAYSEIYFDGVLPPSVLEVPGAMDNTVEFTSMSKTFSMPGWRMGFAVGNERLIAALTRVKSYLDYGGVHANPGGRNPCAERRWLGYRGSPQYLQAPPRRLGRELRQGRMGCAATGRDHVCLGKNPGKIPSSRFTGILQASGRKGRYRGCARHRLRRAGRRLYPHRAG